MPFAHCIDCGSSALIDPSGRCPEGHEVGAAGARVAAAIGSTGPHPDEPKPWVGVVELDPTLIDAGAPEPRVARPPSLPATEQTAPVAAAPPATDDLLRELHALGDLGDLADLGATPAPVTPRPAPAVAPTPVPPAFATPAPAAPAPAAPAAPAPVSAPVPIPPPAALAVTPGSPTPPSSPEEATELDELASLAAAIGSLDDREALTTPAPAPAPAPAAPAAPAAASALDELWAAAETAAPAVTPPAPTAVTPPAPTAVSPLTPAPSVAPAPPASSPVAPLPSSPEPAPATGVVATAEAPPAPEAPADAAPLSPFDGSFTARGDGVGRRTQRRLDAKATKKGLFRR